MVKHAKLNLLNFHISIDEKIVQNRLRDIS